MKILFLANIPSPYRVHFFNELGKRCDLTVVFEKTFSNERDESWKNYSFEHFKGCFLKGISTGVDTAFSLGVRKYVKDKSFDHVICATFSTPTGLLAVQAMKRNKIPYWLETDGGSPKSGNGIKEKLKKWVIRDAAGYFSTSRENDAYYLAYGASPERIFRYPFTSLFQGDLFPAPSDQEERAALRKKLGITESKVVLSVGRFTYLGGYGKGYDVLLRSAKAFPKEVGWYIVGGAPTTEFEAMKNDAGLTNVHFVDFKSKEELKEYYRAADLFVLMTVGEAWGLVINEAMSCGLPVITTDRCIAGTELIRNGENGFLLPVGDDVGLTARLNEVLLDRERLQTMSEAALRTIADYTIENMVQAHLKIFQEQDEKQI